ncbi:MAG: SRPBCC family protein [Cyclobacteriaceae bacterium]|jgi:hypothetical protein|nr:SRPBCC family protein [Cyclobacteriaceae bacterium]
MKQNILYLFMAISITVHAQKNKFSFSHTETTTATAEQIWQIWTDVPNWKQWDNGLQNAELHGEFSVGTKGKLIPDKGPKASFVITQFEQNKSYTFKTRIPFGWLVIERTLVENEEDVNFTHHVAFTGLLKKFFYKKLGKRYKEMLPQVMREIKIIAEKK